MSRIGFGFARAAIVALVLGAVMGCDDMFSAELVQENETVGVAGVSVYPKFLEMDPGESTNQLNAQVVPVNASNRLIMWESSDPSILTIDAAGVITAGYADGIAVVLARSADGEHLGSAVIAVGEDFIGKVGPAGGYIFYEDEDDQHPWRFLEAAPYGWYDGGEDPEMAWSNVLDSFAFTWIYDAIGTGEDGTRAIIDQEDHSASAAQAAVKFVHHHEGVTYDDWFLPSLAELNQMWLNLAGERIGNFSGRYWSATEIHPASGGDPDTNVWTQEMMGGNGAFLLKGGSFRVRPVRSF